MNRGRRTATVALAALLFAMLVLPPVDTPAAEQADLIVVNAHLRTMTGRSTKATAMAIRKGQIIAIGTDGQMRALSTPQTEVLDLWGRTVFPGFIDSHGHLDGLGDRTPPVDFLQLMP